MLLLPTQNHRNLKQVGLNDLKENQRFFMDFDGCFEGCAYIEAPLERLELSLD